MRTRAIDYIFTIIFVFGTFLIDVASTIMMKSFSAFRDNPSTGKKVTATKKNKLSDDKVMDRLNYGQEDCFESQFWITTHNNQFCSNLWSEQTCLTSPVVYMELDASLPVCREVHSLQPVCCREYFPQPVCRGECTPHLLWGKEEPVACHNKPCYWSPEPHKTEIQVSYLTDGNHTLRRVEKARGCLVWGTQVTRSYDPNRHMNNINNCNRKLRWPS